MKRAGCWIVLLFCGCGGSSTDTAPAHATVSVESCRDQFAASKGYGYESDVSSTSAPPPDDAGSAADAGASDAAAEASSDTDLDEVVLECQQGGGTACDSTQFLTHQAALCVARQAGLAAGVAPVRAGLLFQVTFRRVAWNVENVLHDDGQGSQSGDSMLIDAVNGAVLQSGSWGSTP
jgi:hypothetical protein